MAMPEERHPLAEGSGRRRHVVHPPLLQLPDVEALVLRRVVAAREDRRLDDLRLEEAVDGLRVAVLLRLI